MSYLTRVRLPGHIALTYSREERGLFENDRLPDGMAAREEPPRPIMLALRLMFAENASDERVPKRWLSELSTDEEADHTLSDYAARCGFHRTAPHVWTESTTERSGASIPAEEVYRLMWPRVCRNVKIDLDRWGISAADCHHDLLRDWPRFHREWQERLMEIEAAEAVREGARREAVERAFSTRAEWPLATAFNWIAFAEIEEPAVIHENYGALDSILWEVAATVTNARERDPVGALINAALASDDRCVSIYGLRRGKKERINEHVNHDLRFTSDDAAVVRGQGNEFRWEGVSVDRAALQRVFPEKEVLRPDTNSVVTSAAGSSPERGPLEALVVAEAGKKGRPPKARLTLARHWDQMGATPDSAPVNNQSALAKELGLHPSVVSKFLSEWWLQAKGRL